MCPNVNERRNVPNVDGAITRNGNTRRAGSQPIGVIDVGPARHDRRDQRQHLAARSRGPDTTAETHRLVDEPFQTETQHQRRRHNQTGVGHQTLIIEGHSDGLDRVRYSAH